MRPQLALAGLALTGLALAPAASAQQTTYYQVYFDAGSTKVNAKGAEDIGKALPHIKKCMEGGFMVTGNADTFLPDNQSSVLATERARSVKDYLITKGVPDSLIAWRGHSEANLAVPTKDGVKEPKNNRVEIRVVCD